MKNGRLDQLNPTFIKSFLDSDYAIYTEGSGFVQDLSLLKRVYERMELLEIEGKF